MQHSDAIRVLNVDDHAMFREGIAALLGQEMGFEVTHRESVAEALTALDSAECDILLLDYDLGGALAGDLLDRLDRTRFQGRVVLLTAFVSNALVSQMVRRYDVDGIILMTHPAYWLTGTLRQVHAGRSYFDPEIAAVMKCAKTGSEPKERVDRPRTRYAPAHHGRLDEQGDCRRARVTESPVKRTVHRLFRKTGAQTRSHLVRLALERGLNR